MSDITVEDVIEMTKGEKQDELIRKMLEYLTKDKIKELKKIVKEKTQSEFVIPLRNNNKEIIEELYNSTNKELPRESINLLNQAYMTIKNVHELIKNKCLVDSNVLLRSAFENIEMGMMIYFDQNVYDEFKKLGLKDSNDVYIKLLGIEIHSKKITKERKKNIREYTKIQRLTKNFGLKLKEINNEFFGDLSNTTTKNLLLEYYDKLCLFTHSTLVVNQMVEVVLNGDEDFFLVIAKQNVYFLEILLNLCLKHIIKENTISWKFEYMFFSWLILINDIDKEKYTPEYLSKYKGLLYEDINREYLDKNNNDMKNIQELMKEIERAIWENPVGVIELLEMFLTGEEKKELEDKLNMKRNNEI